MRAASHFKLCVTLQSCKKFDSKISPAYVDIDFVYFVCRQFQKARMLLDFSFFFASLGFLKTYNNICIILVDGIGHGSCHRTDC